MMEFFENKNKTEIIFTEFIDPSGIKTFFYLSEQSNLVEDDELVLRRLYPRTKAKYIRLLYPNPGIEKYINRKETAVNILISHSASRSNRHIDAIQLISDQLQNKNIKVFAVLSYGGDEDYINLVIKKGKELLGECFYPIMDFMPVREYSFFLKKIDAVN